MKVLVRTGHDMGVDLRVRTAVEAANETQKRLLVVKVAARFGEDCAGTLLCPLGPGLQAGYRRHARSAEPGDRARAAAPWRGIRAYDPVAMDEARRVFGDLPGLSFASHQADALLIATEWREFKSSDVEQMRTAQRVGDLRWPQPLRPGPGPRPGAGV